VTHAQLVEIVSVVNKIRVESYENPMHTKVFVDDVELTGVYSVEYRIDAKRGPYIKLELFAHDVEITGPAEVEIVSCG